MKNIITEIACVTSLLKLFAISHTEIENFPPFVCVLKVLTYVCVREPRATTAEVAHIRSVQIFVRRDHWPVSGSHRRISQFLFVNYKNNALYN